MPKKEKQNKKVPKLQISAKTKELVKNAKFYIECNSPQYL